MMAWSVLATEFPLRAAPAGGHNSSSSSRCGRTRMVDSCPETVRTKRLSAGLRPGGGVALHSLLPAGLPAGRFPCRRALTLRLCSLLSLRHTTGIATAWGTLTSCGLPEGALPPLPPWRRGLQDRWRLHTPSHMAAAGGDRRPIWRQQDRLACHQACRSLSG